LPLIASPWQKSCAHTHAHRLKETQGKSRKLRETPGNIPKGMI